MSTLTVGVMVIVPMPEPAAALKNFCAVGAVLAAGIVNGYEMPFVGSVQEPTQTFVGVVLMVEAVVDSECVPVVNAVDVIVRFQPAPIPLVSTSVNPNA